MSKSMAEITRHPARFGVLAAIAIAVALLALLIARIDTEAVHNEGMLEMDGNVAFDGGDGFDPGTTNCPYVFQSGPADGGAQDCISSNAAFDWADVCDRTASGALAGYITEASSLPSLGSGKSIDDLVCQQDFIQGATDDISYHTGSDKDFQEMGGAGVDRWHCTTSANATSKADILNAYSVVGTVEESGDDHQLVYIGAERDAETGSVFNGYWILQSELTVPGATTTAGQTDCTPVAPADFAGLHQCGDVLIRFNYDNGGRIGSVRANEWVAPSPGFVGTFNPSLGCDQLTGTGDANSDGVADNVDDCTAAEQASAESHSVPGGFLCEVPPAQGDCRVAVDQTAPGDDLCGRVNGAPNCKINPKNNDPFPPPCSGPGCFSTEWEPDDDSCAIRGGGVLPPTFSEMGVDLTGLNLELPCIATILVESRSSPSIDATLKDLVLMPTGEVCESSLRTEIHDVANHGDTDSDIQGTTVYRGTVIHDAAFVTPTGNGPNATGSVTFTLFSNGTCDPGEEDANVISTETVTITVQIPAGIPSGTEGQIDSGTFDTSTTTASAISYSASADLDDPYADSELAAEDCETLSLINPSTTLDKSLAFSIEVTYSYSETNDGDDPLTNPSVTDASCVTNGGTVVEVVQGAGDPFPGANVGDANGDGVLDPGETFEFECTVTLTEADLDSFPVTNTAIGHGTDSLGRDVTVCIPGAGTPTPPPGPDNGNFCDPDETDTTSIDITVDQGKE